MLTSFKSITSRDRVLIYLVFIYISMYICMSWERYHLFNLLLPPIRRLHFHWHLFVCLLAGLCKNCSTYFHKIWWKGSTWATEETTSYWWQYGSRYVAVRVIAGLWVQL